MSCEYLEKSHSQDVNIQDDRRQYLFKTNLNKNNGSSKFKFYAQKLNLIQIKY